MRARPGRAASRRTRRARRSTRRLGRYRGGGRGPAPRRPRCGDLRERPLPTHERGRRLRALARGWTSACSPVGARRPRTRSGKFARDIANRANRCTAHQTHRGAASALRAARPRFGKLLQRFELGRRRCRRRPPRSRRRGTRRERRRRGARRARGRQLPQARAARTRARRARACRRCTPTSCRPRRNTAAPCSRRTRTQFVDAAREIVGETPARARRGGLEAERVRRLRRRRQERRAGRRRVPSRAAEAASGGSGDRPPNSAAATHASRRARRPPPGPPRAIKVRPLVQPRVEGPQVLERRADPVRGLLARAQPSTTPDGRRGATFRGDHERSSSGAAPHAAAWQRGRRSRCARREHRAASGASSRTSRSTSCRPRSRSSPCPSSCRRPRRRACSTCCCSMTREARQERRGAEARLLAARDDRDQGARLQAPPRSRATRRSSCSRR